MHLNPDEHPLVLIGTEMYNLAAQLYPICRSISGEGLRQSLSVLKEYIPLEVREVPSGTQVFDWDIPDEWNIRDAWVKDASGKKIIDFKKHNLHILNYSMPFHGWVDFATLRKHLYSLPEYPDWIPYRTSYYNKNWGFCIAHNQLQLLGEGNYEVLIDSTLEPGFMNYGEYYLPGKVKDEVLFSAHICHPSLANDNLSGISLLTFLAKYLQKKANYYSYRFLFIPGTIGSICWLASNENKVRHIRHGLVVSLVGDSGGFHYKKSRQGDAEIDRSVKHVLAHSGFPYKIIDFSPYGYDERQFCSPGFNLPVGNLTRSQFGQYPEYHSSADNLSLIQPQALGESFDVYRQVIALLEHNFSYCNLNPKCEPQLGKRGIYNEIGGNSQNRDLQMAMLWVLNFSDGNHDLLAIAEKSGYPFDIILHACRLLLKHELLIPSK